MPKFVGVTYERFLFIEAELKKLGFREISRKETRRVIEAHGLHSNGPDHRPEIGFEFFQDGYRVRVWTSCLREEVERCRKSSAPCLEDVVCRGLEEDSGWVLITNAKNEVKYFADPTHRTKNFAVNLLRHAWISHWKVSHRPLCPECGMYMVIFRKKSDATMWGCFEVDQHAAKKPNWQNWDKGLPKKALGIALAWRDKYRDYKKRAKKEGKSPRKAKTLRTKHVWVATKQPYAKE